MRFRSLLPVAALCALLAAPAYSQGVVQCGVVVTEGGKTLKIEDSPECKSVRTERIEILQIPKEYQDFLDAIARDWSTTPDAVRDFLVHNASDGDPEQDMEDIRLQWASILRHKSAVRVRVDDLHSRVMTLEQNINTLPPDLQRKDTQYAGAARGMRSQLVRLETDLDSVLKAVDTFHTDSLLKIRVCRPGPFRNLTDCINDYLLRKDIVADVYKLNERFAELQKVLINLPL